MNEMLDSQLSAMFDNELPGGECELLARRLSRDEALQVRWKHYAVIGAVLRGEHGITLNIDLGSRVRGAVASEPALAGAVVLQTSGRGIIVRRIVQGAAGIGVAAGVAALSVLWLRSNSPLPGGGETLVAQTAPAHALAANASDEDLGGPDSYVVPAASESRAIVPTAELANYVVAHSEYSGPLTRRNLLSSLVASEASAAPTPQSQPSKADRKKNAQDAQ